MNLSTKIYSKTGKGTRALSSKSLELSADALKVLSFIDSKTDSVTIMAQFEKLSENVFRALLSQLENGGYIRVINPPADDWGEDEFDYRTAMVVDEISAEDFFAFTTESESDAWAKTTKEQAQEAAAKKVHKVAEASAWAEESARLEADRIAREEAARKEREEQEALRKAEEAARLETERKAREEAERKAHEAEEARLRAEAEARARAEEAARLEADRIAREEARRKSRKEKAARRQAAAEARARAKDDSRLKADRLAREEKERKAYEAEEARLKAEAEARVMAEEAAKLVAERSAREEAELKARVAEETRLRAEAEARATAEETARLQAECKAIEEEEALRKAESEAKIAAERAARAEAKRKARAEKEARRQATAEARARAKEEARQKAVSKAIDKAERWAEHKTRSKAMLVNVRPGNWAATATRALVIYTPLALVLLLGLLHFANLGVLLGEPIEKILAETIGEPVTVREVRASLFPRPRLTLSGIAVGADAVMQIGSIRVLPAASTLFEDVKTLETLEIDQLAVDATNLDSQMQWIRASATTGKLKIQKISLKNISFKVPGLDLPAFDGNIEILPSGDFSTLVLSSADHNLTVQLTPQNGDYQVALNASSWKPPLGTPLQFSEFTAKGVASKHHIRLSQIEGSIYGGTFRAKGVIDWSGQPTASGNFQLENVSLPLALPAMGSIASVDGTLTASVSFMSRASEAGKLAEAAEISATFIVLDGRINGINLASSMLSGGSHDNTTRFDRLTGNLQFRKGFYQYRQLALDTAQFHARGNLDIQSNQRISGKVNATLAVPSRQMQSNFRLAGKVGDVRLQ